MKPKQHHYRLLHFINWALTPDSPGVNTTYLASVMMISESECRGYLLEMREHTFTDCGAWVERARGDNWVIRGVSRDNNSTGGYSILEAMKLNVFPDENKELEWKEMTRAGMDSSGNETKVENAVIPSGTIRSRRTDPEGAAERVNSRFREPDDMRDPIATDESGFRPCPRCHPTCKLPKWKKTKFCRIHKRYANRDEYKKRKAKKLEAENAEV